MGITIIEEARHEEHTYYEHKFTWRDDPGAGFGFRCDKDGKVDRAKKPAAALENYDKCIRGEYDVVDHGVQEYTNYVKHPAVGRCVCGEEVVLDGFTCPCYGCGREYNWAGQELAPREYWGEETGEHPSDLGRL